MNKNPRKIAIDMIKPYVLRGDTLESLVAGGLGHYGGGCSVHIGGYTYHGDILIYKAKRDEVVVDQIDGQDCCYKFKVTKLYEEINSNQLGLF